MSDNIVVMFQRKQWVLTLTAAILGALVMAGCAKRQTEHPWPEWKPTSLVVLSETREQLPGGQASVKLVVRGEPSRPEIEDFLRDYVDLHRQDDEEMWVAVFLEGMDVQSVEYAMAIARPGDRVRITVRESAQTYR